MSWTKLARHRRSASTASERCTVDARDHAEARRTPPARLPPFFFFFFLLRARRGGHRVEVGAERRTAEPADGVGERRRPSQASRARSRCRRESSAPEPARARSHASSRPRPPPCRWRRDARAPRDRPGILGWRGPASTSARATWAPRPTVAQMRVAPRVEAGECLGVRRIRASRLAMAGSVSSRSRKGRAMSARSASRSARRPARAPPPATKCSRRSRPLTRRRRRRIGRVAVERGEHRRILERPLGAAQHAQPLLEIGGDRRQVLDVLGGVAQLIGRQRTPGRCASRAWRARRQRRLHQRGVGQRRAEAGERRRDLRVEQAAQRRRRRDAGSAGRPTPSAAACSGKDRRGAGRAPTGRGSAPRRSVRSRRRWRSGRCRAAGGRVRSKTNSVSRGVRGGRLPTDGDRGERVLAIDPGGGSRHQKRTEY